MLNKLLLIVSVILLALCIAFDVNYINYSMPIEYKDYKKITLHDFKGFSRINETLDGQSEFAFIVTEIRTEKRGHKYDVKTLFHPSRSYVFKTNIIGEENLLTHELYHFHITEYIARKLRKEITDKKNNVCINQLLQKYKAEEDIMQRQYDEATYHSYYVGEQLKWQHKIDSLLYTLNQFQ